MNTASRSYTCAEQHVNFEREKATGNCQVLSTQPSGVPSPKTSCYNTSPANNAIKKSGATAISKVPIWTQGGPEGTHAMGSGRDLLCLLFPTVWDEPIFIRLILFKAKRLFEFVGIQTSKLTSKFRINTFLIK